ncbi:MAG: hypothetical protein ACFNLC_07160 [Prevotella denticola]
MDEVLTATAFLSAQSPFVLPGSAQRKLLFYLDFWAKVDFCQSC